MTDKHVFSLYTALHQKFGAELQSNLQCKATLVVLSHALEDEVIENQLSPVIFAAFQDIRYYKGEHSRYDQLRATSRAVQIFGRSLSAGTAWEDDWFVVVNEPRFKAVLACREIESETTQPLRESQRPFLGIWSYNPEVVDFACQVLAEHSEAKVARAVEEVIAAPSQSVEQLHYVDRLSNRLLREMEQSNLKALEQISNNTQLLSELEQQTTILENARLQTEYERDSLHVELRRLYDELTHSQTLMTQAVIEKARMTNNRSASVMLLEQLRQHLETPTSTTDHDIKALDLLARLKTVLQIG